jgi:hypothetical protein
LEVGHLERDLLVFKGTCERKSKLERSNKSQLKSRRVDAYLREIPCLEATPHKHRSEGDGVAIKVNEM